MKKVLIAVVALVGLLITNETNAQAQSIKVGFFDLETMVTVMPGYRSVDSLLQIYERDSLTSEYEFYQSEFRRLDSTFKADSVAGKAKNVLDLIQRQRSEVAMNLIYWQQIAQNKMENKRNMLAGPLFQQVFAAYQKILQKGNYTFVLNPQALETYSYNMGLTKAENLFIPVAKELKVQLPQELGGGQEEARPATTPKPTTTPKKN
ncbi:MAG TPA: OmpH family outer membrane protein [Chitinophagaceae bacterium]